MAKGEWVKRRKGEKAKGEKRFFFSFMPFVSHFFGLPSILFAFPTSLFPQFTPSPFPLFPFSPF